MVSPIFALPPESILSLTIVGFFKPGNAVCSALRMNEPNMLEGGRVGAGERQEGAAVGLGEAKS